MNFFSASGGAVMTVPGVITATGIINGSKFRAGVDTLAAPGFSWQADTDTGFWNIAANQVQAGMAGVRNFDWAGTSATVQGNFTIGGSADVVVGPLTMSAGAHLVMGAGGQVKIDPGTVALPGLAVLGDLNTGLYQIAGDYLGISGGGVLSSQHGPGQLLSNGALSVLGKMLFFETTAPAGVANYGQLFAIDVAGKTEIRVRAGAAATEAILITEV